MMTVIRWLLSRVALYWHVGELSFINLLVGNAIFVMATRVLWGIGAPRVKLSCANDALCDSSPWKVFTLLVALFFFLLFFFYHFSCRGFMCFHFCSPRDVGNSAKTVVTKARYWWWRWFLWATLILIALDNRNAISYSCPRDVRYRCEDGILTKVRQVILMMMMIPVR